MSDCDPEALSSFPYTECMNMIALPAGPGDAGVITSPFYPVCCPVSAPAPGCFRYCTQSKAFLMCSNIIHSIHVTNFVLGVYVSDAQRCSWCGSQVPELHAKTKRLAKLWTRLVENQWDYVSDISESIIIVILSSDISESIFVKVHFICVLIPYIFKNSSTPPQNNYYHYLLTHFTFYCSVKVKIWSFKDLFSIQQ